MIIAHYDTVESRIESEVMPAKSGDSEIGVGMLISNTVVKSRKSRTQRL